MFIICEMFNNRSNESTQEFYDHVLVNSYLRNSKIWNIFSADSVPMDISMI